MFAAMVCFAHDAFHDKPASRQGLTDSCCMHVPLSHCCDRDQFLPVAIWLPFVRLRFVWQIRNKPSSLVAFGHASWDELCG